MKNRTYLALGLLAAVAFIAVTVGDAWSIILASAASGVLVFGMILDERTEFADAFTLPTPIAVALVADVYDLGVGRNLGNNRPLWLVIQVATSVTSGGAATVSFELSSDAQAAIAIDGTQTIHWKSKLFTIAQLVAGQVLAVVPLPGEGPVYERFLGILSTNVGFVLTGGAINAFLTTNPKQWKAMADGNAGI